MYPMKHIPWVPWFHIVIKYSYQYSGPGATFKGENNKEFSGAAMGLPWARSKGIRIEGPAGALDLVQSDFDKFMASWPVNHGRLTSDWADREMYHVYIV